MQTSILLHIIASLLCTCAQAHNTTKKDNRRQGEPLLTWSSAQQEQQGARPHMAGSKQVTVPLSASDGHQRCLYCRLTAHADTLSGFLRPLHRSDGTPEPLRSDTAPPPRIVHQSSQTPSISTLPLLQHRFSSTALKPGSLHGSALSLP